MKFRLKMCGREAMNVFSVTNYTLLPRRDMIFYFVAVSCDGKDGKFQNQENYDEKISCTIFKNKVSTTK